MRDISLHFKNCQSDGEVVMALELDYIRVRIIKINVFSNIKMHSLMDIHCSGHLSS